jgi:hypothetical protein
MNKVSRYIIYFIALVLSFGIHSLFLWNNDSSIKHVDQPSITMLPKIESSQQKPKTSAPKENQSPKQEQGKIVPKSLNQNSQEKQTSPDNNSIAASQSSFLEKNIIELVNLKELSNFIYDKGMAYVFFKYNDAKAYYVMDSSKKLVRFSKEKLEKTYSKNIVKISDLNFKIKLIHSVNMDPLNTNVAICLSKQAIQQIINLIEEKGHSIKNLKNTIVKLKAIEQAKIFELVDIKTRVNQW